VVRMVGGENPPMDTNAINAWASAHADELVAFEPIVLDPPRVPETGSARVARERRAAAERQRRSRVNRAKVIENLKTQAELDAAIAGALRTVLTRADVASKIRTKADLEGQRVSLHNVLGEAMRTLVRSYGYDTDRASEAVRDRLLR
jgi:hypothetical protein